MRGWFLNVLNSAQLDRADSSFNTVAFGATTELLHIRALLQGDISILPARGHFYFALTLDFRL
jgi:hypothetical protein